MAGRDPFTDPFFAPEDPSCSPPNAFGGETQGPVFRQPPEPGPLPRRGPSVILWRETERVSLAGGRRSSSGERPRGSCDAGSLRVPHRWTDPRFAAEHRAPAGLPPQSLASVHTPSGKQDLRKARTQESQNRRGPMIRGPAGGEAGASEAKTVPERGAHRRGAHRRRTHGSECRGVRRFPLLFDWSKGDILRPEPERRGYGMSLHGPLGVALV